LADTIDKIRDASKAYEEEKGSKEVLQKFLEPHLAMLAKVLSKLEQEGYGDEKPYVGLCKLYKEAFALLK